MDLSILIVNYCTYELTKQTINSIIDTVYDISYEIIVVDNASSDGSLSKLETDFNDSKQVKFIKNSYNDGFAVANNMAFKESTGEYLLLLNSDVIVHENTINDTLNYIKSHDNIGTLGCKVLLPDNTLDKACRRSFPTIEVSFYRMSGLSKLFPKSKRFNRYNLSYLDDDGIYSIDCIVGAFMLLKSQLYEKCGGLDESYFMYGEDIDLCYKIKELGYDVVYYGKCEITHFKGASGKNPRLLYEFYKSMILFYDKHYKKNHNGIVNALMHTSIWGMYYIKKLLSK